MRVIFWHQTGPRLSYDSGALVIEDLNPQIKTTWVIGIWNAIKIAARLLFAAFIA